MRTAIFVAFLSTASYAVPVSFLAVGRPSFLKIHGKCEGTVLKHDKIGSINGKAGIKFLAEVKIDSCDTGIGLRNRHMREKYMNSCEEFADDGSCSKPGKFPSAMLDGTVWEGSEAFNGTLTVHGKPSEVSGEFKSGVLKFKTKLSAHGVETPSFKGITVADDVEVEAPLSF